jgi:Phosphopantetheine attachment site
MINVSRTAVGASTDGEVCQFIIGLLDEIVAEWDHEPIGPTTELGSLGIESINLVYLLAEVQHEYGLGDRLLNALRTEQIDVRGLRVGELSELVVALLAPDPAEVQE